MTALLFPVLLVVGVPAALVAWLTAERKRPRRWPRSARIRARGRAGPR